MKILKIQVPDYVINDVEKQLDGVKGKTKNSVLKTSVNNTAKQAQRLLAQKTSETYVGKHTRRSAVIQNSDVHKGNAKSPTAQIEFSSPVTEIKDYYVSSLQISKTAYTKKGKRRHKTIKGRVLNGENKKLEYAFVVQFKNGHIAVVSRVPGVNAKQHSGKPEKPHYEKLRKILSPSIATAVGGDRVYGESKEKIEKMLLEEVSKTMQKVLGR